ncbi:MAG TPA: hypothetical protein VMA74_15390 [Dyella sp.]|uniref:hypothetical protein n=1 Tax=Dyella sp. TaxID=1869338 RepID=UPI002D0730C5|nr:hypothetical protein [Dyella sp.]HUB91107.1 hypothetical protein [Dyella sp.]
MTLVSQAVFARMCKVSPKSVTKWKHEKRLVMQGVLVDVESTEELMKRHRRKGSPVVLFAEEVTRTGNTNRKDGNKSSVTQEKGNGRIVTLPCTEILEQLRHLDWTREFEWTPEAMHQRVHAAAKCIGWEVAESDLRDDGHWGGMQLRITEHLAKHGLTEDAVAAGFGYELFPFQVLQEVRKELEPALGPDDTAAIDRTLLPLLARPFYEHDRPDH